MAQILAGFVLPHRPMPLLAPDQNPGWRRVRDAFDEAGRRIAALQPDLIVVYSTQWVSILGHQMQADPEAEWVHVDQEFHELGSIPYALSFDPEFASAYVEKARARGLHCRTVSYKGFPIDTGTVQALQLLDPERRFPAAAVSCNVYSDRAETIVLGKAARDAIEARDLRVVCVAVTALSNRMFTDRIDPADDRISSLKDDEWNRKLLEFFEEGRLEDVSQLAREFSRQANGDSRMKAIWWLAACMGQNNRYEGEVLAYEALYGTGGAVIQLTPTTKAAKNQEFDEDDVEVYGGDRNVLDTGPGESAAPAPESAAPAPRSGVLNTSAAPKPVGAYPHARRVGDLLYLSGVGPRQPGTNAIPGGPVRDANGNPLDYDIEAQTRAVIENVRVILEAAGSSLDKVVDITVFLIDMDRDFAGYNKVYAEVFTPIQATRTTLAIQALPTPIAVEFKVVALP